MTSSHVLFPGHSLVFRAAARARHQLGGVHNIHGAGCPNCNKPLMLHVLLDTSDPCFEGTLAHFSSLPLLYCMRCALSWYDFVYTLSEPNRITVIKAHRGPTLWDEWADLGIGDVIAEKSFALKRIPEEVEAMFDKISTGALTVEERKRLETVEGIWKGKAICQIGGHPYFFQDLPNPPCVKCAQDGRDIEMYPLASLANDERNGLAFTYEMTQIAFFVCANCTTVHVQHSA